MRKADVLRFKFGDVILFNATHHPDAAQVGKVWELTPRGGIRVRDIRGGSLEWIGYHHAIRRIRKAGEPETHDEKLIRAGVDLRLR